MIDGDMIGNIFTVKGDMGPIRIPGKTIYDWEHQNYTLSGSGKDVWSRDDEFHYAFKPIEGDFMITCSIDFSEEKGHIYQKAGLMLRASREESSVYADAVIHGNGVSSLQYRPKKGEKTEEINPSDQKPHVFQLERYGKTVIVRRAVRGSFLEEAGRIDLELPDTVLVGLFVCSHDSKEKTSVTFHNLRIDIPAAPGTDGYKNPPKSRMEILDVESGERRILFATEENIEAPNWSPNGKYLLYNKKGLIYRYDFDSSKISQIDTGLVNKNNNDHGISPDGKSLIMSSHHGEEGKSRIYICPIEGGKGKQITPRGPSYWHGISPDGKTLAYCAEREGDYNVWCSSLEGGEEYQLTRGNFLDDGPEFSRNGEEIYFNSTRTGKMKIWKMKRDGTEQQQVTAGETNDWFAHISPNGKKMVYLSYPKELQADSHPHNQRVLIQLVDLEEGETQVLAYLYGGQGTLNVPSWSPDSKYIAFVSYTYGEPGE
jgi:TolB protein